MAENFDLACEEVKQFVGKLSDNVKLSIYGLFKQATVGDVQGDRPGMFSPKDRAKWDAWAANKGKSQQDAKVEYVALVKANAPADVAQKL